MHGGVFVTGTDTGIGKTVIACAIASAAHRRGLRVAVFKPVETGCSRLGDRLIAADAERLVTAAGGGQDPATAVGERLETPAAPLAAALVAGRSISVDDLSDSADELIESHDFTVIEGAGGLLVPVADGVTWLDVAEEFDLPILCVVGDRLGCINHALLTLDRLDYEGAEVCGYVMNRLAPGAGEPSDTGPGEPSDTGPGAGEQNKASNAALIARFSDQRCLGEFPFLAEVERDDPLRLAEIAEQALDLDAILGAAGD